jgi:hypothetical protein
MAVGMCFDCGRLGKKLFEDIDEFFESGVAGEEFLDLRTEISTFPAGLLVRKYVVIVLHDVFWNPLAGSYHSRTKDAVWAQ